MAEYIEREAAIEALPVAWDSAVDALRYAPAADVAPVVHGRWNVVEGRRLDNAICSNCSRHFQAYYEAYHYCPNCGAKMDGGADDGLQAACDLHTG